MDRFVIDPGPRGRIALLACLGIGLAMAGCRSADESALATITRVSPETIEYGQPLVIEGEGFVGDDPVLVLDGVWMPLGRARPEIEQVTVAVAVESDRRAKAFLSSKLKAMWGSEAVAFRGSVTIQLRGRIGMTITGRKDEVALRVSCAADAPLIDALLERRSAAFLEAMGLEVEDSDQGLKAASIAPQGRAGILGIRALDVLLAVDGWPVAERRDLGWMCAICQPRVQVERLGRLKDLDQYFTAGVPDVSREMAGSLAVAGILCGLFFAFASGRQRAVAVPAAAGLTWNGLLLRGAAFLSVTLLVALVPACAAAGIAGIDLGPVLIAALVVGLAIEGLSERRARSRSLEGGGAWVPRIMLALLGIAMIAEVMISAGALGLSEALASGLADRGSWGILETPMKSLTLLLGLGLFGRVLRSGRVLDLPPRPLALIGRLLTLAAFSAIFVLLGLGAWGVPGLSLASPWTEGLSFGMKAWAVILAAAWLPAGVRRRRRDAAKNDARLAAVLVLCLIGAAAWDMTAAPAILEKLACLAAVVVVAAWVGIKMGQVLAWTLEGNPGLPDAQSSPTWLRKC